jgi:hypothetical protein
MVAVEDELGGGEFGMATQSVFPSYIYIYIYIYIKRKKKWGSRVSLLVIAFYIDGVKLCKVQDVKVMYVM